MPAERVVIDIEVNSDIATIVATRRALEDLTDAQRRYNRERDREPRGGGGGGGGGSGSGGGGDGDGRGRRRGGGGSGGRRTKGRYDGFGGQVFDFRGDMGKGIASYGALLKVVNKLAMISLPLMAGALSAISLAFQLGTYFVKMYKAAMSSMASAVGVAYVALTTLLAAQREFSAVQNSPAYAKGALTTNDRFVAAGQAMSMFVGNSQLAVVSSKSLQASFTSLSKVAPITGATTAAFTSLMDVVAGSGGDLDKGSEKLAEFLAQVQKKGTLAGGAQAAKELGPDFEKIVKEAGALGVKTSDEFLKAAAEGKLGETFATKYAGTLDALNNTVMGRFKTAVSSIKEQLTDLGGEYLGETGGAISRLQGIISTLVTRLSFVLRDFNVSGKMGDFLDLVEKGADKLIVLMNKYLGTTPSIFGFLGDSFNMIGNAFDRMQDWMRQFQKAGTLINEYFFKPLFNALGSSFTGSMESLSNSIEQNKGSIESFANQVAKTLIAIGKYGDVVRQLFIGALPVLQVLLKVVEMFFNGLAKFGRTAIAIGDQFTKVFGKIGGGAIKLAALYALFKLATRFFTVLGTMFGRNMKGTMNVTAGVVNVNGGTGGSGDFDSGDSGSRGKGKGRFGKAKTLLKGAGYSAATFGTGLALTAGGGALMNAGGNAGGYDTAKGSAMKTAGLAAVGTGGALMLIPGSVVGTLGTAVSGATGAAGFAAGAGAIAAPIAGAAAAYGSGSYLGSKFKDDSVKSRSLATLAGATSGAAFGAGVGALPFLSGPTGGLSIAVGAALGAAIGGAAAFVKSGKQRRETRKAAKELIENYTSTIDEAFAGGNVDDLLKARDQLAKDMNTMVTTNADPAYAAQALEKYNAQLTKMNSEISNYTANAGLAEKYFNTGAESLNKLAEEAGINIKDKMLNFREVLSLVGKTAEDQARLLKAAWSGFTAGIVNPVFDYFDKQAQEREQFKSVNAAAEKLQGGDAGIESRQDFLKKALQYNVGKFGDIQGLTNTSNQLEMDLAAGGRFANLTDEQKTGMRTDLRNAGGAPETMLKNVNFTDLANMSGGLNNMGGLLDASGVVDPKKLETLITSQMKTNPLFLQQYADAASNPDKVVAGSRMNNLLKDTGYGGAGTSLVRPDASVPAGAGAQNYVANTTITAAMLDGKTIDQIEKAIAKALKEQRERGMTPTGGTANPTLK
jgi:gas vesicle protein